MEVYQNLPGGTLAELINDIIYMSPSPVYKHQHTLQEIFKQVSNALSEQKTGEAIVAPFDVYLDDTSNAVQPDIIVVLNQSRHIIREDGHIHGVPDMLIEILSPGNKDHDLILKKELYERFRVKEYWIVDPDNKQALGYSLKGDKYVLMREDIGLIKCSLLNIQIKF